MGEPPQASVSLLRVESSRELDAVPRRPLQGLDPRLDSREVLVLHYVARWHQPRINPAGQRRSLENSVFVYQLPPPVHPSASPPFPCPRRDAKHGLIRGPPIAPLASRDSFQIRFEGPQAGQP